MVLWRKVTSPRGGLAAECRLTKSVLEGLNTSGDLKDIKGIQLKLIKKMDQTRASNNPRDK